MNNEDGKIWYGLGIDNSGLAADARRSTAIFNGIGNNAVSDFARIDKNVNILGASIAATFGGATIVTFGQQMIKVRGEMQLLEQSFEVLTGSASKSKQMLGEIVDLATESPLEMQPVAKAAQTLMAFGIETNKVMGILGQLTDVSMGNQQRFESLALVYAQVQSAGKLMGQDLLQFINAGFNPLQIIAEQTGKSMSELKNEMSEGAISAEMVADAFTKVTSEGGKFFEMTKKQADGIIGVKASFEDSITKMYNELGKENEGLIKSGYQMATSFVENYESIGRALAIVIGGYGAYKAALIAITAYHKAMALAQTIQRFNEMTMMLRRTTQAQILLNQAVGANPYIKLASILMTIGGLIWAFASNSKDAAEETKGLNKALKDAGVEFDKESAKVKTLQSIVENSNVAYEERKKALLELQKLVPNYNAELTTEGILTNNNTTAIKEYLVQLEKQIKMKAVQEELEEVYKQKRKQEKKLARYQDDLSSAESYNATVATPMISQLGTSGMQTIASGTSGGVKKATADIKHNIAEVNKELDKTNSIINELNQEIESSSQVNSTSDAEQKVKTYSEQLQIAAKNVTDLKGKLKDLQSGNTESADYAGDISNTKKAIAEAEDRYNLLLGIDKKYIQDQAKTLDDLEKDIATEKLKVKTAYLEDETALQRKQISDKIALIEFDRDKTIEAIEKEKQAYIEMVLAKDKSLKSSDVDTSFYDKRIDLASVSARYDISQELKDQKAHYENLKVEFEDYLQARERIESEYSKKRKLFYIDSDEKKGLKQGATQGNIDNVNESESNALSEIDEHFAMKSEEFVSWSNEIATLSIEELVHAIALAKMKIADLEKSGTNPQELAKARAALTKAEDTLSGKQNQTSKKAKENTRPIVESWKDLEEQLDNCANSFKSIGDEIGGVAGEIIGDVGSIASSTLSVVSGITQLVQMSAAGMTAASTTAASSIRAVESASVILAVISAVIQVAMQIAQLFNKDDDYQETIERLQGEIDNLNWELQNRDIVKMRENDVNVLAKVRDAMNDITQEVVNQYIQAGKLSSIWDYIQHSSAISAEINKKAAQELAEYYANISYSDSNIFGMEQYDDATKKLDNLAAQQLLLQEQIRAEGEKKDVDNNQIKDWEQQIEELGGEAVKIINEAFEEIMGGSAMDWANQLGDALFDAIAKGEDAVKAWGETTKEITGDIMKQLLIQEVLMPEIMKIFDTYKSKWFKDNKFSGFDSLMDDIPGLYDELNGLYGGFAGALEGLPDVFKDILGFTEDQFEREASSLGKETASQESVDETNGRLTAMQGHTYNISEKANVIADYTARLVKTNELVLDRLSGIESNTEFCRRLDGMDYDLSSVRTAIEDIRDRGLTIKR